MIAGLSAAERVDATTIMFAAAVTAEGFSVSADMRIGEKDAAHLLGVAPGHLKQLRQEGKGPIAYSRGVGGSRISYRLHDIAAWIESSIEEY